LVAAIDTDISGEQAQSGTLDTDPKGPPARDIHRRVGTAILVESSGGQTDSPATCPNLGIPLRLEVQKGVLRAISAGAGARRRAAQAHLHARSPA